jgi:hypothetical protein
VSRDRPVLVKQSPLTYTKWKKGGDNVKAMAQRFDTIELVRPKLTAVKTTLYELIGAINDVVQPGEDRLVVETVLDLFDTGQVRFLSPNASVMNN